MEKGRIIFLNGVTSAGKRPSSKPFRRAMMCFLCRGQRSVSGNGRRQISSERLLEIFKRSDSYDVSYRETVLRYGKNVLIDGILVERKEIAPHYEQMREILKDNPLDLIEVYCPLDICRHRNILRGDRGEHQSDEQHKLMAKNIEYRMRIDTSINSAAECAETIIKEL